MGIPYLNSTRNTQFVCPILFSGINGNVSNYPPVTDPSTNVTGILERYNYNAVISLALRINPIINAISFVFDPSSSGYLLKEQIDTEIQKYSSIWPPTKSFVFDYYSDFQNFILKSPDAKPNVLLIIVTYSAFKNRDNTTVIGKIKKNIKTIFFFFLIQKKKKKKVLLLSVG